MRNQFKYLPLQFITIIAFGNKISGRVLRCILDNGDQPMYDVEYMDNSEFKRREFYEDELEAKADEQRF